MVPITYFQSSKFSNFLRCMGNVRITELYEVFRYKCNFYLTKISYIDVALMDWVYWYSV